MFQVVQKCKELGPPEGKYFYKAADMANMSATQLVIKVGHMKLANSFPIKPVGESQKAQRIPQIWLLDSAIRNSYRVPQGDT